MGVHCHKTVVGKQVSVGVDGYVEWSVVVGAEVIERLTYVLGAALPEEEQGLLQLDRREGVVLGMQEGEQHPRAGARGIPIGHSLLLGESQNIARRSGARRDTTHMLRRWRAFEPPSLRAGPRGCNPRSGLRPLNSLRHAAPLRWQYDLRRGRTAVPALLMWSHDSPSSPRPRR